MNDNVKKELKVFIPIFAAIILIAIGIDAIMPDKIPETIGLSGTAAKWIAKTSPSYHIPVPELIVYVFLTFIQFHNVKKNPQLARFLFQSKLAIIVFCGIMIPSSSYLYAIKFVPNIWYVIGPTVSGLFVYIFVWTLITGVLESKPKTKQQTQLPKTKKKKKKKKR